MRQLPRLFAIPAVTALVVACGGGAATSAPATSAPATSAPATAAPATAAPATSAPATQAASTCRVPAAGEATVVNADVAGFEWGAVNAKVDDVITWTNGDTAPHGVKTDDGTCRMESSIPGGGTGSLVFTVAGTYPFTCTVHPSMKGTITITQ